MTMVLGAEFMSGELKKRWTTCTTDWSEESIEPIFWICHLNPHLSPDVAWHAVTLYRRVSIPEKEPSLTESMPTPSFISAS